MNLAPRGDSIPPFEKDALPVQGSSPIERAGILVHRWSPCGDFWCRWSPGSASHSALRDRWNVDCTPLTEVTCGSSVHGTNVGTLDRIGDYPCNVYSYAGPEVAYRLRAPVHALVTVELSNLTQDLDLILLEGFEGACDSQTCALSSTAGGTSPESLTFEAPPGVSFHLVVDGYAGATSDFDLTVSCETTPPGTIPEEDAVLRVHRVPGDPALDLSWGEACGNPETDYAVYVGRLGEWGSHVPLACGTDRIPGMRIPMLEGDLYFIVAAHDSAWEGSHGRATGGTERGPGAASCLGAFDLRPCP